MLHLTDETTTSTPGKGGVPFVALESLRAEPSPERGEWAPPVAPAALSAPVPAADDDPTGGTDAEGHDHDGAVSSAGSSSTPAAVAGTARPRHGGPAAALSIWDGPTFADLTDPSGGIGLTPARMTTLDLMRSLEDFTPRSDWHYEDVLTSAPVAESVERLTALDTLSSFDLVASLETAANDIARSTRGAERAPTAVTLTRAERRKRQAEDAQRAAHAALADLDAPSPVHRVGTQAAVLAAAALKAGRDLVPRARHAQSGDAPAVLGAVAPDATAPDAIAPDGAPAAPPAGGALDAVVGVDAVADPTEDTEARGDGTRRARSLIDHGRTHHKHSAATAVGAVAASVLGVLTAALVVGGGGSPHGLQTASPSLSGGAATTSGNGAASGTPAGGAGAPGPLGRSGGAGAHVVPGVDSLLTTFFGPGAASTAGHSASGQVHGTAIGATPGSGGSTDTTGSTPGTGSPGAVQGSGAATTGSGSGGSTGSSGTSGGSGATHGTEGGSGTTGSGTTTGSGAGSSTSSGSTHSSGGGSGAGSSTGSGSGSGSSSGSSSGSGGGLSLPLPPVTVPTVTVPSVTVPTLPAVTPPSSGSSGGSTPPGVLGTVTGLL